MNCGYSDGKSLPRQQSLRRNNTDLPFLAIFPGRPPEPLHNPNGIATLCLLKVRSKIELPAADPFVANNNVKKLVGREAYHLRVGDWRVIYEIEGGRLVIHVLAVAPRGGAYQ